MDIYPQGFPSDPTLPRGAYWRNIFSKLATDRGCVFWDWCLKNKNLIKEDVEQIKEECRKAWADKWFSSTVLENGDQVHDAGGSGPADTLYWMLVTKKIVNPPPEVDATFSYLCNTIVKVFPLKRESLQQDCDYGGLVKTLSNKVLTELSFANCEFSATQFTNSLDVLDTSNLTTLDISDNSIADKCVTGVAKLLRDMMLTDFPLHLCGLRGTIMAGPLADLDKSSLTKLDIGWNRI